MVEVRHTQLQSTAELNPRLQNRRMHCWTAGDSTPRLTPATAAFLSLCLCGRHTLFMHAASLRWRTRRTKERTPQTSWRRLAINVNDDTDDEGDEVTATTYIPWPVSASCPPSHSHSSDNYRFSYQWHLELSPAIKLLRSSIPNISK